MATATTPPTTGLRHDQNEHGLKRRQSEEPDDAVDSKRQRTSPGKNSPTTTRDDATGEKESNDTSLEEQKPADTGDTLRKSSAVDEKQRSKRLFGALLGNLRQPGDRTSKRRQEIESRSKAKLQRQDDERLEDRQRRLEQLAEQRKITQVRVDEQNVGLTTQYVVKMRLTRRADAPTAPSDARQSELSSDSDRAETGKLSLCA